MLFMTDSATLLHDEVQFLEHVFQASQIFQRRVSGKTVVNHLIAEDHNPVQKIVLNPVSPGAGLNR